MAIKIPINSQTIWQQSWLLYGASKTSQARHSIWRQQYHPAPIYRLVQQCFQGLTLKTTVLSGSDPVKGGGVVYYMAPAKPASVYLLYGPSKSSKANVNGIGSQPMRPELMPNRRVIKT